MDDQERLARLAFAAQLALLVHRELSSRQHSPCGVLYSIDNPDGIAVGVRLCGCRWPAWEVRQL